MDRAWGLLWGEWRWRWVRRESGRSLGVLISRSVGGGTSQNRDHRRDRFRRKYDEGNCEQVRLEVPEGPLDRDDQSAFEILLGAFGGYERKGSGVIWGGRWSYEPRSLSLLKTKQCAPLFLLFILFYFNCVEDRYVS